MPQSARELGDLNHTNKLIERVPLQEISHSTFEREWGCLNDSN